MSWNEAWRVLGCAVVGAGVGVVIVFTGGPLTAPYGAAIWTVTAVQGTTVLTAAGCSALAVAGVAGVTANANFGNAQNQQSHNFHRRQSEWRDVHTARNARDVYFFVFPPKKLPNGSIR